MAFNMAHKSTVLWVPDSVRLTVRKIIYSGSLDGPNLKEKTFIKSVNLEAQ